MKFAGFDRAAIAQLDVLPTWSAAEYAEGRSQLATGLMEPGAALIAAVAISLDNRLTVKKRSSVSPLHRDLRFAPAGAARYKDHLLLTTWLGQDKNISPTFWIRIDAESVGFASGSGFDTRLRERWRAAVADRRGESLGRAIAKLRISQKAHDFDVAGKALKKVPAPWDADHVREDLLRLNSFQVRFREALPRSIEKPDFVRWCATRLGRLMPIHQWLVQHLGEGRGAGRGRKEGAQ